MEPTKKITVAFFKSPTGNEPARDWLKGLSASDKKSIGEDLKAVELSWPVGLPLVRKIEADLWEVRSTLAGRIARTFFTVWDGYMVLLHGFIKKGQKTPSNELNLARKRCRDVQNGGVES